MTKHITLRPYQIDLVTKTIKADGNVLLQAPTGSGKSVMAREVIRRESHKKILIVAPKRNLLQQLHDTFIEFEPQIIHGKKDYNKQHNVFVSTLQTAHKRELGFKPDIIIVDEIHYGFDGKMLAQLLENFEGKLIGLSATPFDRSGRPLKGFTTHLNDYDLDYMIGNGYLVPIISYQPVHVNLKNVKVTAGDYNLKDLDIKFNNIESVMEVVKATKDMVKERHQAICFCININHSEAMAEAFNSVGISATFIHSKMSEEAKVRNLEHFKSGKVKVLTSVDMMTTGFDYPPVDTVILARATQSQNLYKQMIGRVLRTSPIKDNAVLLDCCGVINTLGLPTKPIRPNNISRLPEHMPKCSKCGSERTVKQIVDGTLNKVCLDCGYSESLDIAEDDTVYECELCNRTYDHNQVTLTNKEEDNKLYIKCDCGHYTLLSSATLDTELEAIFDDDLIEKQKARITGTYSKWLIDKYDVRFLFKSETQDQLEAICDMIEESPADTIVLTVEDIEELKFDEWRLIEDKNCGIIIPDIDDQNADYTDILEDSEYTAKAIKIFESDLMEADTFNRAYNLVSVLCGLRGERAIQSFVKDKVKKQISRSSVKNMDKLMTENIKHLYKAGVDSDNLFGKLNLLDDGVAFLERRERFNRN